MGVFEDAYGSQEDAARRLAEWLLIESVSDLAHRCRPEASRYERLGISAILRRLLMDRRPVLHLARKRLAIPSPTFAFTPIAEVDREPTAGNLVLTISLGSVYSENPTTTGGADEFLAAATGFSYPSEVTVREAIRYFAHSYGGVHLGHPETQFERVVQIVSASMPLLSDGWTHTLVGIAEVTTRALAPIVNALESDPWPSPHDLTLEAARRRLGETGLGARLAEE